MKALTGEWSTKKSLRRFILSDEGELAVLPLLLLGAAVALVHDRLDFSMGMPGHHGLEWMTVLLFARFTSRRPWAALIVAAGTTATDLGLADSFLHAARNVPLYFIGAATVDLLYRAVPARWRGVTSGAAIGVAAHGTKILIMALLALSGVEFGVFRNGFLFPLATYAGFGLVGGASGALLAQAWRGLRPGHPPA